MVLTWFDVVLDIFAVLCKARYHNSMLRISFRYSCAKQDTTIWHNGIAGCSHDAAYLGGILRSHSDSGTKETKFAYDAQRTIQGCLRRGKGLTIQKMVDTHPFGHLIAENMNGVVGLTPVHVVHHIAYDNGDEASLIYQHLHVEEEDVKNVREGPVCGLPFGMWRILLLIVLPPQA